MSDKPEN
ncbi:hypothetical protein AX774_g7146, partial [Zancudomyces culisetae]